MKLYVKDYKDSDSLIQDIRKHFNEGKYVGVIGDLSPYTNKECFLCEFNPTEKLDRELMKEVNHTELKRFIINSCNFNNEKNILTIKIKLEGFEEINKQLNVLINKCDKLHRYNITNNITNNINVTANGPGKNIN